MSRQLLVIGGGIGGLTTAWAAARAGWQARVYEQAPAFTEVGAGVQLGPNVTGVLRAWGLLEAVQAHAFAPEALVSLDALRGAELARLPLGRDIAQRYGAPYLTVHRADLHAALLEAVRTQEVALQPGVRPGVITESADSVSLDVLGPEQPEGDALVGADGLWSATRAQVWGGAPPRASSHVAYRGLVPMAGLPAVWRDPMVRAWLGPRLHAVTYPVRAGTMLNVVIVVEQAVPASHQGWDLPGTGHALRAALGPVCAVLHELIEAVPAWGCWVLHDRPPVAGPQALARGRIALVGDAAHPMRPYLAQGAAMAIEDAWELGRALSGVTQRVLDVPAALQRYALGRWQRVARVQRRSLRNGVIFHASGPVRLARDAALRSLGARLMDVPWLYRY